MSGIVGYGLEFLPILFGAAIMGLLMSIRMTVKKVIIETRLPAVSGLGLDTRAIALGHGPNMPDPVHYTELDTAPAQGRIFKEDAFALLREAGFKTAWRGLASETDDVESAAFRRTSYENMLIAGIAGGGACALDDGSIFSIVGHARCRNLDRLSGYISKSRHERIGIFFSEKRQVRNVMSEFSPGAGYVLAFALNLQLDAYGIGNELHH